MRVSRLDSQSVALSRAIASVDVRLLAGFLCEAGLGLSELEARTRRRETLRGALEVGGFACPTPLDAWGLPDAVWRSLQRVRPQLGCYPLGELLERGVKKTISEVSGTVIPALRGRRSGSEEARLRRAILAWLDSRGKEALLRSFLTHFLFELCMDVERRGPRAYRYEFGDEGRLRTTRAERNGRRRLAELCQAEAEILFPLVHAPVPRSFEEMEKRVADGLKKRFHCQAARPVGPILGEVPFNVQALSGLDDSPRLDPATTCLLLDGKRRNVSISYQRLERWQRGAASKRPLHPLVRDLIELGAAVYLADLHVDRAGDLGRQIRLLAQVRYPGRWEAARPALERALSSLGRDDVHVCFSGRPDVGSLPEVSFDEHRSRQQVCLLSGGLDSLAGAVELLERGRRPLFVSHYTNGILASIQRTLVERLSCIYRRELDHVAMYVAAQRGAHDPGPRDSGPYPLGELQGGVMAYYLRSFLFLSLAAAAALHSGSRRVLVCENGPLALSPIFSEGRVNTRSAHPGFLAAFAEMIHELTGAQLRIENPFLCRTKGETVKLLSSRKVLAGLVPHSVSCWNYAATRRYSKSGEQCYHDGRCLSCLDRRVALHSAGLESADGPYKVDVFQHLHHLPWEPQTAVADYFRFAHDVRTLPAPRLLERAPDFSVSVEGVDPRRIVRMYRRHSRELRACFLDHSSAQVREMLRLPQRTSER